MALETRTTDAKGRLSLPKAFANSTVVIEVVSATELRIRKARVIPEDELPLAEEAERLLTTRDRDRFLELLARPPKPNAALKRAIARYKAGRRG